MSMRDPDFLLDGWCLEDAEKKEAASPATFRIPPQWIRKALEPGDIAQLIFRIDLDDEQDPDAFERMWVVVTTLTEDGYMGVLDNEPSSITENGAFWYGSELPFSPRHIIDVREATAESRQVANRPPPIPWRPTATTQH